jgi:hypothetical protein
MFHICEPFPSFTLNPDPGVLSFCAEAPNDIALGIPNPVTTCALGLEKSWEPDGAMGAHCDTGGGDQPGSLIVAVLLIKCPEKGGL